MYHFLYGFLYLLSLLPMRVLYGFSDAVHFLVFRIFGYRMDVVMQNLQIAFPEKSIVERRRIASKFYRNLIDTFIETIKMISASDSFLQKRFSGNWEVLNEFYSTGRAIHVHMGHTFNWEWGNYIAAKTVLYKFLGVYMPVKNKTLDRLFLKLRSRGGTLLLPATPSKKFIAALNPHRNTQYLIGLAADQSPGDASKAYWLNFFGRRTAFVTGPEKAAMARNLPVFFCYIRKPKRGYYEVVFTLAEENPKNLQEGQLTVQFARYLEKVIAHFPDMWLWSHRRWKREWNEEYQPLWVDN
ncbi:MAG: lysophospholipid acyltransferase family protein [Flavitalea sp.]